MVGTYQGGPSRETASAMQTKGRLKRIPCALPSPGANHHSHSPRVLAERWKAPTSWPLVNVGLSTTDWFYLCVDQLRTEHVLTLMWM